MATRPVAINEQEHISARLTLLMFLNGNIKLHGISRILGRGYEAVKAKYMPQRTGRWKPEDIDRLCEEFDVSEAWLRGEIPWDPIIGQHDEVEESFDFVTEIIEQTEEVEEENGSRSEATVEPDEALSSLCANDEGPNPFGKGSGPSFFVAGAGFEPAASGL